MTTSRHVRKIICVIIILGFPGGSDGKESACNVVELSLIPGLVRSPGEGKDYAAFQPGQFHGWCSPWGHKELDTTE